jgi:predicted ATPase
VEGIAQLQQGVAARRVTGAQWTRPLMFVMLAEAHGYAGQVEAGLHVLAEACAVIPHSGDRNYEAEVYRLKGELLLACAAESHPDAEACFQQALDVARKQQAKSLELRSAMSLSRLWQQQGKRQEAHDLLAPVYNWFAEGFDTADLQEAKALLYMRRLSLLLFCCCGP